MPMRQKVVGTTGQNSDISTYCRTWQLATNETPPPSNTDSVSLAIRSNLSSSNIHTLPTLLNEKMSNSCEQLSRNMSLQRIPCWAIDFSSEPKIDTATTWPNRHVPVPWELAYVCLLTLMFWFWFLHCESRLVSYLDWATRQEMHPNSNSQKTSTLSLLGRLPRSAPRLPQAKVAHSSAKPGRYWPTKTPQNLVRFAMPLQL